MVCTETINCGRSSASYPAMNVHHVHQEDENHFNKCSHPACNVTIERLKKYCLLRSKENKVLEKYEKAAKLHDTISKRRQSIDISHLLEQDSSNQFLRIDATYSPKQRRFSVPNRARPQSCNLSSLPRGLLPTLNEFDDDHLKSNHLAPPRRKNSVTPTPQGSSPVMQRKLSSSLTNLKNINVEELNNSLHLLHQESDLYLQASRKLSSLHEPFRRRSYTPEPSRKLSLFSNVPCRRISAFHEPNKRPYWQQIQSDFYTSFEELDIKKMNFVGRSESLDDITNHPKRPWNPTPKHLEAIKKLENRKALMSLLDSDINKVNMLLKRSKCNSLPIL